MDMRKDSKANFMTSMNTKKITNIDKHCVSVCV